MQGEIELEPIGLDHRAYRFFPKRQEQKIGFGKSNGTRIMFYGQVEYDELEKKKLDDFKKYLANKNYDKEYYDQQLIFVFLYFCGKNETAYQEMLKHEEFKAKYIRHKEAPFDRIVKYETDQRVKQLTDSGFFYICGRDRSFRPTMVFNLPRTNIKDTDAVLRGIVYVQEQVIEKMFLPGQVECWNIIFDLGGMGITDLPVNSLKSVLQLISANYGGRLYKLWMLNCPGTIYFSWKVVKNFLAEVTVDKISIVKKNTDESLWKIFDKSQIQQKYGGTQPNKQKFFPFVIPRAAPNQERLLSDEQYLKRLEGGFLDKNKIDPKFIKGKQQQLQPETQTCDLKTVQKSEHCGSETEIAIEKKQELQAKQEKKEVQANQQAQVKQEREQEKDKNQQQIKQEKEQRQIGQEGKQGVEVKQQVEQSQKQLSNEKFQQPNPTTEKHVQNNDIQQG